MVCPYIIKLLYHLSHFRERHYFGAEKILKPFRILDFKGSISDKCMVVSVKYCLDQAEI